jgi:hypothetical protein
MKRSSGSRKTAKLSESVHQQLNMYALAASAAGVGMLALVQPSEGKIIYTSTHKTIKVHQHYNLDLNHDGISDFTIQLTTTGAGGTHLLFYTLAVLSPRNNAVVGGKTHTYGRGPYAFALQCGAVVGPKQPFPGELMALAGIDDGFSVYVGQWLDVKNRYLGLKFHIQGKIHYGWVRLSVVSSNTSIASATLTGYAYETVPNKPIVAGKTKGADESDSSVGQSEATLNAPAPTPAMLGLLAMGSSGLSIWRRKELAQERN